MELFKKGSGRPVNNREGIGGGSFLPLLFASALFLGSENLGWGPQSPQLRGRNQRVPP